MSGDSGITRRTKALALAKSMKAAASKAHKLIEEADAYSRHHAARRDGFRSADENSQKWGLAMAAVNEAAAVAEQCRDAATHAGGMES
jgi:hypothetical protein